VAPQSTSASAIFQTSFAPSSAERSGGKREIGTKNLSSRRGSLVRGKEAIAERVDVAMGH
jgi:hypothetical protein